MYLPRLDPMVTMIARLYGLTYLDAAKVVDEEFGRDLSLEDANFLVQHFARNAATALFTYISAEGSLLFTIPSADCMTVTFVTDVSVCDFFVQAVWDDKDGSERWSTEVLPLAAIAALLRVLPLDVIAISSPGLPRSSGSLASSRRL
jgi:hypothetical protein